MRMRGMVLAGVAAAAILTACETSETGQAGDAELQTVTVTGSQQDSSAPPPPPKIGIHRCHPIQDVRPL